MDKAGRGPWKGGNHGPPGRGPRSGSRQNEARGPGPLRLSSIRGRAGAFDLVHPRCVEETRPDYEEGLELWKAGDPEEARDALRFALQGCGDNLWVHVALGKLALQEFKDPSLARGHFGYAVELARRSIPHEFAGVLPRDRATNRPLYEAFEGLIASLRALGQDKDAEELAGLAKRLGGDPR